MADSSLSCRFCGRDLSAATDEESADYCSDGCRAVDSSLEPTCDPAHHDESADRQCSADALPTHLERTFLRIDGMHSATCETYLETVAESCDGVVDAEASYITESIRVDFDPNSLGIPELVDSLSVLDYKASPREEADAVGGDRGLDEVLGYRYAAGVVFASFLMLPYLLVIYPVHVTSLLDLAGILSRPENGSLGSGGGPLILPVFLVLTAVVVFFTGLPMLRGAYIALKLRRPNTDLLVATTVVGAYVYSMVMGILGRSDVFYDVAVLVAASVVAASYYEALSKRTALDSLTDRTLSRATEARRYKGDDSTEMVAIDAIRPGDRVLVKAGERVPVDGELVEGECTVDESVVTGESTRVVKHTGDSLVGGSVVTTNAAVVRVADDPTSGIDRIRRAVWAVQSATHGDSRRADRMAARVAPAVLGLAFVGLLLGFVVLGGLSGAVVGFLTVPLVASPWALGLATPLAVATSVNEALERGVVVLDETVLERLRGTDVVVFDKTGTLTTGQMEVLSADAPDDLLRAAAALEQRAAHPAAEAVVSAFGIGSSDTEAESDSESETIGDGGPTALLDADAPRVESFSTHPAGVEGVVDGTDLLVGNLDLFDAEGWSVPETVAARAREARSTGHLPVVVGRAGTAEGVVVVGDEPREGWETTLSRLVDRGLEVVVLTGDSEGASQRFADSPSVSRVFAGVPPEGKTETVRRLQQSGHVTMVGDGTNDAPALAAADLGIALGSGTALASEAADLAVTDDDLSGVETAFDLADASRQRLVRNTVAALAYNLMAIPLALVGLLNPVLVMAALVLTVGLVVGNSARDLLSE